MIFSELNEADDTQFFFILGEVLGMSIFVLGHFLAALLGGGVNFRKLVVLEVSSFVRIWPLLADH